MSQRMFCILVGFWNDLSQQITQSKILETDINLTTNIMKVKKRKRITYSWHIHLFQLSRIIWESRKQNKSPGLQYGSPNLPDKSEFGYIFFLKKDKKSSEFYLQIKKNIAFFVKDGCIVVKLYSTLVYVHPF